MSQKSKQIIARILILVFALYYANICFFYHSHIINGVTIVHSHFHNKEHAETGTHSQSQLTLISVLSAFHSLQAVSFTVVLAAFLTLLAVILQPVERSTFRSLLSCIPLRAPPYSL